MEVMLDRFVFRCDHGATRRFPENETTASGSTRIGAPFRACIDTAAPPTISRFYLEWPGGPDPEASRSSDLVAAHRGCVLLRLTSFVRSKTTPQRLVFPDDYFFYRPGGCGSSSPPSLTRLPTWIRPEEPDADPACVHCGGGLVVEEEEAEVEPETRTGAEVLTEGKLWLQRVLLQMHEEEMALGVDVEEEVVRSSLVGANVGLVCRRDSDEYVVAHLQPYMSNNKVSAELCVLRGGGAAAATQWDVTRLPVSYSKRRGGSRGLELISLHATVPFGDRLCWIDYSQGMIVGDVLEPQNPELYFLPFPPVPRRGLEQMRRGVSATDGGRSLKFVDVVIHTGMMPPTTSFTIYVYALTAAAEDGGMMWELDADAKPMTCEELWGLEAPAPIPHEVPLHPLVRMDEPHVLCFMLAECTDYVDTITLVTVDMESRKVLSVYPYTKGAQDLDGEDADLAEEKSNLPVPFFSVEFSKTLSFKKRRIE